MNDENQENPEFLTIQEVARELRFSVDTLRRHFVTNQLKGIKWVDFLGNGKLRASRESVESFKAARIAATQKAYTQPVPNSSPQA